MPHHLGHGQPGSSRRTFLTQSSIVVLGTLELVRSYAAPATGYPSLAKKSPLRLGLVSYNLAKDWDISTILKNCSETGFEGIELRTTHAHGVEVSLSKEARGEVRKRFADSAVVLMGLGSAFDFHTPDPAKLRRDIEATKEYIVLSHDVGGSGVKVRPNGFPKEVPPEKTLEQIGQSLHELGEFGEKHGQQIRLEVHGEGTQLLPNIQRIMEIANHRNVGVCWNSNDTDLAGDGFDANFERVKSKIFSVHLRDLHLEHYPFRKLLTKLVDSGFRGWTLAEIPDSKDPQRIMSYFRSLWLAYQGLL